MWFLAGVLSLFFGAAETVKGIVVSNYVTLQSAITQGGVINQFSTNSQITLSTFSETFNISKDVEIDGTTNTVVLNANQVGRLFTVARGATLKLANVQVLGGISALGGAISNQGTLIISNCFFYSNTATNANGVNGAGATNSNNSNNGTSGTSGGSASGGAIYSTGTLIVAYTTFSNNVVTAGSGGSGGAGSGSSFLFGGNGGAGGNGGSAFGGAITAYGTNTFFETQFIQNQCVAGSGGAGGAGGSQRISGNSGSGGAGGGAGGGGLYVSGELLMTNCLFFTNTVIAGSSATASVKGDGTGQNGFNGGAAVGGGLQIAATASAAYVENTTFFKNYCQGGSGGNTADKANSASPGQGGSGIGGGLSCAAALTQLRCCTLATNVVVAGTNGVNSTGTNGNGLSGAVSGFDLARIAGTVRVSGTIFSGDTNAAPFNRLNLGGAITDAGYNLSSDSSGHFTSGSSHSLIDPQLDSTLADHGGPNIGPTNLVIPTLSLSLLPGPPNSPIQSPAIGALIGIAGVTFPAYDETLAPRGNVADIGAFEVTPPSTNDAVAPSIDADPQSVTTTVGQTFSLAAGATGDNLVYQWVKNSTNAIAGANSNLLAFSNVTVAASGSYTVVVANTLGAVTSQVAVITVNPAPVLPRIAILSPAPNARITSAVMSGTASDAAGVDAVNYWITNVSNGGNVLSGQADLAGGGGSVSNWTIPGLPPGTDVVAVQATSSGINSLVTTRTVFVEQKATLSLSTDPAGTGTGTVAGVASVFGKPADQAQLLVGQSYILKAVPAKGSIFGGWTLTDESGTTTSDSSTLQFIMTQDLSIVAAFDQNFFPAFTGVYNGLFYDTNNPAEETAGMLSGLTLNSLGGYSATLKLNGGAYAFTGGFDGRSNATAIINRAASLGGPITISMTLGQTPQITGQVKSAAGTGYLIANISARSSGTAQYTMLMAPSDTVTPGSPPGDGYGLLTDNAGTVTLTGALADGTAFSQSVQSDAAGDVPVYASLYANTGLLLGWINLTNFVNETPADMALIWIKKAARTGRYSGGFTNSLAVNGSPWIATTPFALANGGNLVVSNSALSLNYNVSVNNNIISAASPPPTNSLRASINSRNGLLSVIFGNGAGRATTTGTGVVLQNQSSGGGYFLNASEAGAVLLSPILTVTEAPTGFTEAGGLTETIDVGSGTQDSTDSEDFHFPPTPP